MADPTKEQAVNEQVEPTEAQDEAPVSVENELAATRAALGQTSNELDAMREKLATAQRQVAEIRQAHTEAAAEFKKTRERLQRDHRRTIERSRHDMASKLFGVADNLERTLESAQGADGEGLLEGVQLVRDQFFASLAELGVVLYAPKGEPFDPTWHEAIGMIPVSTKSLDNHVVAVFQPGFRSGDQVLRAAMVQVGRYVAPPSPVDTPDGDAMVVETTAAERDEKDLASAQSSEPPTPENEEQQA